MVVEVESPGTVFTGEGSEVDLMCEIYGYPRDSSSPVWTRGSDKLQGDRYTTTVINAGHLSGSSISSTERVVFQLTIRNVTEDDSGEYTCSVPGNSTTATLTVVLEGNNFMLFKHSYAMSVFTFLYMICKQLGQHKRKVTVVSHYKSSNLAQLQQCPNYCVWQDL